MEEVYSLRLDHYILDGENKHKIEEPLVVQMIYDRRFGPASICLNNMIDTMRTEIIRRSGLSAEANAVYADNVKYLNLLSKEEK